MDIKHTIIKCDWLKEITHGWGNGYVAIPKGHPMFGMDYDNIHQNFDVDVHGGLTFATLIAKKDKRFPDEFIGMWVIGFDCNHYNDSPKTCPQEFVEAETLRLVEQVKNPVFSERYKQEQLEKLAPELLETIIAFKDYCKFHDIRLGSGIIDMVDTVLTKANNIK